MTVKTFTVNPFSQNTYVCHVGRDAVMVDAGSSDTAEHRQIEDYITRNDLVIRHLLLTHAHLDHIFGCAHFAQLFGMRWRLHAEDLPLFETAELQARTFGVTLQKPQPPATDLEHGMIIRFGPAEWKVLHTPGHAPWHVCFYDEENGVLLGGDVLFQGSIGRTDLWGGSMDTLMTSIREELLTLPDETLVYPGHGLHTTIGAERLTNPFLKE